MTDPLQRHASWSSGTSRTRALIAIVAVVAFGAVLTLNRLGAADVCGANEAVEGVFVQQMVEHGALLFPLENGRSPMYKPPLFHWTAAAVDRLAGIRKVTSFNLRLPAALYAIAGIALTMVFAWSMLGAAGAVLAGLILCGSYQYIEEGRIGRVDMTLCFCEALALFAFAWWYTRDAPAASAGNPAAKDDRRGAWLRYLFALALGLGVLAKGPVGALLPALACGIFLAAERRLSRLRSIAAPGPVLLAVVVGGSWYAACFFGRRYGFLDRQLGSENFGRFFGALGWMPPWYYLKPLLLNSGPLSLIAPVAVYFALRTYWTPPSRAAMIPSPLNAPAPMRAETNRSPHAADQSYAAVRLFAIFWIVTVTFFSIAAYKRRAYLLPLWPVSAVMIAWWVEEFAARYYTARIARTVVAALCVGLAIVNLLYLPLRAIRECANDSYRRTAAQINRIVGADEPLYSYRIGEEPAPLLFYLDRNAPALTGKLGDAPPGYVIIPAEAWPRYKSEALDLEPVYESSSGAHRLILLRHGKAYAVR